MADTLDVKYEFERWMSQQGESAVYIGDGLYSSGDVSDQAEAFAAGVELVRAALASRPAEVDDEGLQSVPTEITREMMRAIQTQSELGAYACSNLSDAYNLINELWSIALSAAPSHTTNKEK